MRRLAQPRVAGGRAPEAEAVPAMRLHRQRDIVERGELAKQRGDLERAGDAERRAAGRAEARDVALRQNGSCRHRGAVRRRAGTSVVLPAPFGPMTAWISPGMTVSVTSPSASSPPNRLVSPAVASSAQPSRSRPIPRRTEQAEQPRFRTQHDEDQQRSEQRRPMLGPARQHAFEQQIRRGAEYRPDQRADPAEDHHHHDLAGARPMQDRRRDEQGQDWRTARRRPRAEISTPSPIPDSTVKIGPAIAPASAASAAPSANTNV